MVSTLFILYKLAMAHAPMPYRVFLPDGKVSITKRDLVLSIDLF